MGLYTSHAILYRYDVVGFMDKNKDTLFQDFKRLLFSSQNATISTMWPEGQQKVTAVSYHTFNHMQ